MSQKINSNNTFNGGLLKDFHPLTVPNHTYTDALNMEIITSGENQNIFQNIKGDKFVVDLGVFTHNGVDLQFEPLGFSIHNDVAYIVAGAFDIAGKFITGTIGSFPSPDWAILNDPNNEEGVKLDDIFRPFHNFSPTTPGVDYTHPFISNEFNFERNRFIDVVIQPVYDRSVNVVFTDFRNPIRTINSRFRATENIEVYVIGDLDGALDNNQYSNDDWDRIALVQTSNFDIDVISAKVKSGGEVLGGGYRYYFKYITDEKNTTNIIYESPFIPIGQDDLGISNNDISDKLVEFIVQGLDSSYAGIQLYFAHFYGDDIVETHIFKVIATYKIIGDTLVVTHTGREETEEVEPADLYTFFTPIRDVASIAIVNDRLALGGIRVLFDEDDLVVLEEAAKKITIWERRTTIDKAYSDPNAVMNKLGYWPGEVYEFAVVFELRGAGKSPAFPITGMDNFMGRQADFVGGEYPPYTIDIGDGFDSTPITPGDPESLLINNKGLFRLSSEGAIFTPTEEGVGVRHVRYLTMDVSGMIADPDFNRLVSRYSIVRRKRIKNVLLQGMINPTIKLPSSRPGTPPLNAGSLLALPLHARWIGFAFSNLDDKVIRNMLGLNYFKYEPVSYDIDGTEGLEVDILPKIVYAPQYSIFMPLVTGSVSNTIYGYIGQKMMAPYDDDTPLTIFGNDVHLYTSSTGPVDYATQHLSIIASELDLNKKEVFSVLSGTRFGIEIQKWSDTENSPVMSFSCPLVVDASVVGDLVATSGKSSSTPVGTRPYLLMETIETVSLKESSSWVSYIGEDVRGVLVDSGVAITAGESFTGAIDRNWGYLAGFGPTSIGGSLLLHTDQDSEWLFRVGSNTRYSQVQRLVHFGTRTEGDDYGPIALMANAYSVYLGIRLQLKTDLTNVMPFRCNNPYAPDISVLPFKPTAYTLEQKEKVESWDRLKGNGLCNAGHLVNVFNTGSGRWNQTVIRDLYKFDSNGGYFACSDFLAVTGSAAEVDIFRGDAYISRIYKRVIYKKGIVELISASQADAGLFGTGLNRTLGHGRSYDDVSESEKKDRGLNLADNDFTMEIATYSNINADLRSLDNFSDEELAIIGYPRSFYPHKESLASDARPDSVKYNHGYTGDRNPVLYRRIEEDSLFFITDYPNRVVITERHKPGTFYNSYRNIRGANFRDYGVKYGPIVKIIAFKNILLSIHYNGILTIGVDEQTLLSKGQNIVIDTAKVLNPTPVIVSESFGTRNPESIIKTDYTVFGVDYAASAIWMFLGDKVKIISDFVIRTLLDAYKEVIEKGDFTDTDSELGVGALKAESSTTTPTFIPRVYSTFNATKHTITFSYVAENTVTKEQIHVGSVNYNTIEQKWVSRLTKGVKFSYQIKADEYFNGTASSYKIWGADSLVDQQSGKYIRNSQQGYDVPCSFEIVINENPMFEKILDSLQLVCNKNLPDRIEMITFGEYSGAADEIWGESPDSLPTQQDPRFKGDFQEKKIVQNIVSRDVSSISVSRSSILHQNAYYKNNSLYIEVGKTSSSIIDVKNKRIRDKAIKVRFIYTGADPIFIQAILSILRLSSN